MAPDAEATRWVAGWGDADSGGRGIRQSGSWNGQVEHVNWATAREAVLAFIDTFLANEERERATLEVTEHDDLLDAEAEWESKNSRIDGVLVTAGAEWVTTLESCTGYRYAFVIEWDGPQD